MEYETLYHIDAYQIQEYQQNRYPLLFVDQIERAVPGAEAEGYKNFTYNEWYFPAHFEDEPNVPGFIQIETLTQVFLMTFLTIPEYRGMKTGFVEVRSAKFKKKIVPGMRLEIKAKLDHFRRGIARGRSVGFIDGEVACEAELVITIPDILNQYKPIQTASD